MHKRTNAYARKCAFALTAASLCAHTRMHSHMSVLHAWPHVQALPLGINTLILISWITFIITPVYTKQVPPASNLA